MTTPDLKKGDVLVVDTGVIDAGNSSALRKMFTQAKGRAMRAVFYSAGNTLVDDAVGLLLTRLPEFLRMKRRSLVESDIDALLQVMMPDEAISEARKAIEMDNARERARFLQEFPCVSGQEVAALAGHKAANASVTASRWKKLGKIFSVPAGGSEFYPLFQFRDGQPHPTVAKALAELPRRKSPWQIAFWFTSSNGWLEGAAPADRLDDSEAVVTAARRESEDILG